MAKMPYEIGFKRVLYFSTRMPVPSGSDEWQGCVQGGEGPYFYMSIVPDAYHGDRIAVVAYQAGVPQYVYYNDKYYVLTGLSWGGPGVPETFQLREIQEGDPAGVAKLFHELMDSYVE